ncbi:P-loop containing nucleoside triphosphate hydrolase [Rhizophagus irregularis DAOM 181602=DAOM 197198]|nr:P-loop containing nucleoside triphosphate hydrolase [Rhizophagus irregularis DAOM 181602=DAOM 197198]
MSNYSSLSRVLSPFRVQTKFEENSLPARYTMAYYLVLGKVPAKEELDYVEFDSSQRVMILRNTIYEMKKNTLSSIDRSDLKLWKVDIPFDCENDKLKMLDNAFGTINIEKDLKGEKMLPGDEISKYLKNLPTSSIHILVQPPQPATTGKRQLDLDYCDEESGTRKKGKSTYPEESDEGRDNLMVISPDSPPSSGKSTVGQTLRDFFESLSDGVYINLAGMCGKDEIYNSNKFDNYWKKMIGRSWTEISECKEEIYVIIDEIQVIYGNGAPFFWGSLKTILSSESNTRDIHIVLLGVYHPNVETISTPLDLHYTLSLSVLLLTWEEFSQLVTKFIQRHVTLGSMNFIIPDPVRRALYNLTAGHVGLCRFVLRVLRDQFRENGKTVEMLQYLASTLLFNARSRIYSHNYLFKAPLNVNQSPSSTFDEFLLRTIERMSSSTLKESLGKGSYLYERTWQMEWFRTAKTVIPENASVSSDVGGSFGSVGFLDFYVDNGHCWGVELTREGEKLKEHAKRFESDGIYAEIPLKQWAILDFRRNTKQVIMPKKNFWYVLYSDDYKTVIIKRKDCDDIKLNL